VLYFAYGSNLDFAQMRERCPSAQFLAKAMLPQHRLAFTRKSTARGCGVADAVPDPAHEVWGAVFSIAETDVAQLDKSEGFVPGRPPSKSAYLREERHVWRDGDKERPLLVSIYLANRQEDPPRPNAVYKKLIVDGAKSWHLPPTYIEQLEKVAVLPEPK
jgi:gamma-glutamylcyclotransferase (GGCT)/AIG2-like uncharacterized protein YtfP